MVSSVTVVLALVAGGGFLWFVAQQATPTKKGDCIACGGDVEWSGPGVYTCNECGYEGGDGRAALDWDRKTRAWDALRPDARDARIRTLTGEAKRLFSAANGELEVAWNLRGEMLQLPNGEARRRIAEEGERHTLAGVGWFLECIDLAEEAVYLARGVGPLTELRSAFGGRWEADLQAGVHTSVQLEMILGSLSMPVAPSMDGMDAEALLERGRAAGLPIPREIDPMRRDEVVRIVPLLLELLETLPRDPDTRAAALLGGVCEGSIQPAVARWLWPDAVLSVPGTWRFLELVSADDSETSRQIGSIAAQALLDAEGGPPALSDEPWRAVLERMHWNALDGAIGRDALDALGVEPDRSAAGVLRRALALLVCDQWATAFGMQDFDALMGLRSFVLSSSLGAPGVMRPADAAVMFDRSEPSRGELARLQWGFEGATALAWAVGLLGDLPDVPERQDLQRLADLAEDLDALAASATLRDRAAIEAMRDTMRDRYRRHHPIALAAGTQEAHMLRSRAGERWKALTWLLDGDEAAEAVGMEMATGLMPAA
ncbi:MAG: DUF4272 domain-containing protein [Alphaproteobacteria bacterium]|nr:DUF4272 domain-containing protein [Alphaproteobacteria bacterium]